jgi:hypothetical protein
MLTAHPTSHWLKIFKGKGFPFAPVNDIQGTFEHPQTRERDLVREIEHPRAGKIKLVAPAVQYNGKRMEVRLFPPSSPFFAFQGELTRERQWIVHPPAAGLEATHGRGLARTRLQRRQDRGAAAKGCRLT